MIKLDADLENLIYKILQNSPYPVYSGWYKEDYSDKTVTVFLCNIESAADFSDDENEGVNFTFQFSTFSKDKEQAAKQRKFIKKELKKNGFIWSDANNSHETDTELYHYADRFNYYVSVEEE